MLLYLVLHIWCPLANMSDKELNAHCALLTEKRQKSCLSLVQLFNYSAVIPSGIFPSCHNTYNLNTLVQDLGASKNKNKKTCTYPHIHAVNIESKWKWTEAHDDGEVSEDEWRWGFDSLCYVSVYC